VTLSSLTAGDSARIAAVSDRNAERLRYLAELGIVPGVDVTVIAREPFEGPIALRIADGERRTIGPALAGQILVTPRTR
jgi:DtxR family Mn-dependent transcriptional regulator